jgi:alkylation response protein AidB-like acyl-CoA dehydrogenase
LSWYALWVRTDEAEPRVGYLLVPAGLAGTRIEETWDHLGLRASGSHDVVFEDVLVPFENAVDLRLPAEWLGADPQAQAEIAVLISALYTGVAEAARDWLLGFLHARKPSSLGASLATLPRVQEVVGRIESLLLTNQRLIAGLARGLDDGVFASANEAGLIKSVATNNAVQAVELAQSLTSNHGLTRHNPLSAIGVMCCAVVSTRLKTIACGLLRGARPWGLDHGLNDRRTRLGAFAAPGHRA